MQTIPITNLSSYLYCPIKFYIEEVLKIKKIDRTLIIKGTLKHKTLELTTKKEKDLICSIDKIKDFESLYSIYKLNFFSNMRSVILENKYELDELHIPLLSLIEDFKETFDFEAKNRAKNVFDNYERTKLTGTELWKNLTPKLISEKKVESKKFKLRGRVDRVEDWPDKYVPIEFKNSMSNNLFDSQKIQLGSYILVLNQNNESNITNLIDYKKSNYGYVHFLKDNQKKMVLMNEFLENEILNTRDKVINILETKRLIKDELKKCSYNKCKICPYVENCKRIKEQFD